MASDDKPTPTSVWKKEISFRRKPQGVATGPAPGEKAAQPARPSIWKKELSLRKKPQGHVAGEAPLAPAPQLELPPDLYELLPELLGPAAAPEPEPAAPAAAPVEHSWLTQPLEEVSEPPAEAVADARPQPPEPPPEVVLEALDSVRAPEPEPQSLATETGKKVPFYKKELSLRRSSKARVPLSERKPSPKRTAKPRLRRIPRPRPSLPAGSRGTGGKKLVGLKIGASQLAAARIDNGGAGPELVQVARQPLEAGIVVGGELRDPAALAAALKEFFSEHRLPRHGVRLGIANNRIGVRSFDVVGIDDPKQLANAIRFRAQEVLPIPIEETVLDYHVLSTSTDADGVSTRRVLLVVAYRELVDRYVDACRAAGIQIVGIDLEAFALLRALAEPRTALAGGERGALVAVSVGHDRSTFAVSDGRNCEFTRVLEWGGLSLNVAIAQALDLSPGEAEPVKRALSFAGAEEPPDGFHQGQLDIARDAARRGLQAFARELVSSLQFYQNQPGSLSIGEIVLTGGTAHLAGFAAELARLVGVPVRVGDPLVRVKVSQRIRETEQAGSFAIAIGLGIED